MKTTLNLEMKIPEGGDPIDIADITGNFEVLDAEIAKKANASGGDISGMTVKTLDTIATEFPVPSAGESSKTFLGKVKKFFSDFIAVKNTLLTISNLVNNGQTTEPGLALDARYGKTLYELYAQLNSNLSNVSSAVTKIHDLSNADYVTNFNAYGNATSPGCWRVYNASGTAANAPYTGAVGGYVEIIVNGDPTISGTNIFQTLHDNYGDMYTRTWVVGSQYGNWRKLTP